MCTPGGVTPSAGQGVVAINADSTGDLYVAISDGTIYRLNSSLAPQATGTVPGKPVNIACDSAGNVYVATSTGLYMLSTGSPNIIPINSWTYTGTTTLVGVGLDGAGDVVAADSGGIVYATGTGLSLPRSLRAGGQRSQRELATGTTRWHLDGPETDIRAPAICRPVRAIRRRVAGDE